MGIAVLGLNHETAPVEVRERFVFPRDVAEETLVALTSGGAVREAVLLSTCNRTELYAHVNDDRSEDALAALRAVLAARAGMTPSEAERYFYRREEQEAVRHVFRVTSSLDSMVVGEAQIQGQVRQAYEGARTLRSARVVGPVLSRLFEHALSVGGRVRAETTLGQGAASIPSAAVELARKIFGPLRGHRALILGAGEMSELAMQCLAGDHVENVVVANRTVERAEEVARRVGGSAAGYDRLDELLEAADIVVSATAAPHYMVTRSLVDRAVSRRDGEPLLVVDLALPRDVEPAVGELSDVFLYDIDDLRQIVEENRERRVSEVPEAEGIVDGAVQDFWEWYGSLDVVPLIRAMRARAEATRAMELEKALRKLSHLGEADRAVVEALAVQLTNKLLHEPTVRLKEGAGNGHPVIAEAARYLFDLSGGQDDSR
ncbi:MAG TPA: glutamyl-tRNA reductase [Longimicrobiales bacterium]|nr:glutamyl-tRNA reductase [Longimicrobiales bacterium]